MQADVDNIKFLYYESAKEFPIDDEAQANAFLEAYGLKDQVSERLFNLLVTVENTGYKKDLIYDLANHFFLSQVLDSSTIDIAEALYNLAAYIPGQAQSDGKAIKSTQLFPGDIEPQYVQAYIQPLDSKMAWKEALTIARASSVLGRFPFSNARVKAVAEAATRMQQRGYRFTIDCGAFQIPPDEIARIVAHIKNFLRRLGCLDSIAQIAHSAHDIYEYAYEQILFGQRYSSGLGERPPTIPFGLLFNVAATLPINGKSKEKQRREAWGNAIALARDFVAMLDLEAYTSFAFMNTDVSHLETRLRQLAHYDHCFALRQWHFSFTAEFLLAFFGNGFESKMKKQLGWSVNDAVKLTHIISGRLSRYPTCIPIKELIIAGIDGRTLYSMLKCFAYAECAPNKNYRSPFDTAGVNMLFRPSIMSNDKSYLVFPPVSLVGPAIYEATFSAIKGISHKDDVSKLRGDGTARLVRLIFTKWGFQPTFENAKYDLGPAGEGDCDLVFEDDENIYLVECKAKALTRGAMTGAQGDALLDFAGGLFAAQAQALKHERILRTLGEIVFDDQRRLEFRSRRITRLAVTLVDHGTLQNNWVLNSIYHALLSSQVSCPPNYSKRKQVIEFNANLQMFREESQKLLAIGYDLRAQALNIASASVAQLDVILNGAQCLSDVNERMVPRITYSTLNILLEFFNINRIRNIPEHRK